MTAVAGPLPGGPEGLHGYGSNLDRMLSLSDGIFGFSMTLLIVTLAIPVTTGVTGSSSIFTYFSRSDASYALLAYTLAFVVIAGWWGLHQRLFGVIVRYDPVLARLNTFFLLCISVTPWFMALVFTFGPSGPLSTAPGAKVAVALFGLLEVATGLLLWGVWRYAAGAGKLLDPKVRPEWIAEAERDNLGRVAIFGASVAVALVLPEIGIWVWAASIAARPIRFRRRHPPPGRAATPERAGGVQTNA